MASLSCFKRMLGGAMVSQASNSSDHHKPYGPAHDNADRGAP